ncbi:MAG: hypothetical protein ACREQC_18655, partial [Candidatus Binataceae bacterium]
PLAIGFFGLGTGYFIWGGQELFDWPKGDPDVNKSLGMWGFWMPGFMQLLCGTYIFVGLTWFQVFTGAPLYMAGLAFTAYGVHWFALGHRRFINSDSRPDAWMALAFILISILGLLVFAYAGDIPVTLVFVGLTLIYISDAVWKFGLVKTPKLIGFWHVVTGLWLMYCMYAATFDASLGWHWWL